jgi:hypothetical protein
MADRARDAGLGLSEPVLNEEYSPDYAGSLGGPAWFYRRFRDRVIDAVWPDTESVDTTATRRWDDHALSYRPPPLVEHRKRL